MPRKARRGDTYLDEINGYIIECVAGHPLFPERRWAAQQRRVMAEKLGRQLESWELVHHRDENKHNNARRNLKLTTRKEHPSHHKGQRRTVEVKARMKESAKARCTPAWRKAVSKRVKHQHQEGKFGRQTWRKSK